MLYYNRIDIRSRYHAVRKDVVGREDVARKVLSFVERMEELPSFTIKLQLYVAIPRRALKSLKKRDFGVGFSVIRFFR